MALCNKVFERINLQFLREFLLYEGECEKEIGTYQERLSRAENLVLEKLKDYPRQCNRSEITDAFYHYVNVTQNVYMEVGMKSGAKLIVQLLSDAELESTEEQPLNRRPREKARDDFERRNDRFYN